MVWVAALVGFGHYALFGMLGRMIGVGWGTPFLGASWGFSLVATAITGALFAWAASRFFVEARRTGELELLLTTPLGAEQIVSTQWSMLQRLVRLPLAVMLVPMLFQGLAMLLGGYRPSDLWRVHYAFSTVLGVVNTILSVCALCWLGLWFGLRVIGQGRVILWAVLITKGFPYVLTIAWSLFYQPLVALLWGPGPLWSSLPVLIGSFVPQLTVVLFHLWLIHIARWQLTHELTGAEPLHLRQIVSRALPRIANSVQRARQWRAI